MRSVVAIAICLAGMAMFSSCEKSEIDDNKILYAKGSKLKHISYVESVDSKETGMIITQYEYDEQGRKSKESQPMYENGTPMFENGTIVGLFSYSDYVYNSEGLLEKIIYNHSNTNSITGFLNLRTHTYSYDNNEKKQKEVIVYPQMTQNRVDSTIYFYDNNRLIREDKYEDGYFGSEPWRSVLVTYIEFEYDNQGKLVKKTNYSGTDNTPIQFSLHSYQNGLIVKTEIFNINGNQKIREIRHHYDSNDNLIYLESEELSMYSSAMSYITKYDYY
jgi:hypothetical protein